MHWIGWLFLIWMNVFAALGWHVLIRAARSSAWPTTIGTLLRATVVPGDEGERAALTPLLQASVNGIAAGMQSTG